MPIRYGFILNPFCNHENCVTAFAQTASNQNQPQLPVSPIRSNYKILRQASPVYADFLYDRGYAAAG